MNTAHTNGFWSCHLYLLSNAENDRLCQVLSLKWAEIVLDLGGVVDFKTPRLSLATWKARPDERRKSPAPLRAALEMKAVIERMNATLVRIGRKPISYSLVLDGVRPAVTEDDASLQLDIRNRKLMGDAVRAAVLAPGLKLSAEATAQLLPYKRAAACRVPVSFMT